MNLSSEAFEPIFEPNMLAQKSVQNENKIFNRFFSQEQHSDTINGEKILLKRRKRSLSKDSINQT